MRISGGVRACDVAQNEDLARLVLAEDPHQLAEQGPGESSASWVVDLSRGQPAADSREPGEPCDGRARPKRGLRTPCLGERRSPGSTRPLGVPAARARREIGSGTSRPSAGPPRYARRRGPGEARSGTGPDPKVAPQLLVPRRISHERAAFSSVDSLSTPRGTTRQPGTRSASWVGGLNRPAVSGRAMTGPGRACKGHAR
jgi:hypothetical protein